MHTHSAQCITRRYSDPSAAGASYTLLHKAVEVGSDPIIAALLKAGADVHAGDHNGAGLLHWLAAFRDEAHLKIAGKPEAVVCVYELVTLHGGQCCRALMAAAAGAQIWCICLRQPVRDMRPTAFNCCATGDLIVKHKAAVGAKDAKGATPLHAAASQGNPPMAALLLRHGASAGDAGPGHSPLHAAAKRGSVEVMEQLLAAGAEPHVQVQKSRAPIALLACLPCSHCRPCQAV